VFASEDELEDNKLYYRPVDSQEAEGVLLHENWSL
jgi:hypothetical protein